MGVIDNISQLVESVKKVSTAFEKVSEAMDSVKELSSAAEKAAEVMTDVKNVQKRLLRQIYVLTFVLTLMVAHQLGVVVNAAEFIYCGSYPERCLKQSMPAQCQSFTRN